MIPGKSSRADSVTSDDSITPELYHFRPIKAAPKTPPRRVRNEKKKNSTETSTTSSSSSLPPAKSKVAVQLCLTKEVENVETPALKRRLLTIEIDRKKKRKRLALQKCRENINDPVPTPPHAVAVDAVENAACHLNGAATFLCKKWTKLQKRKPLASTNGAVSQPSLPQRKNCWHSNNARPVLATPKYTPHTTAITAMLLAKRRKKLSENQKKFKLNNGTYVKKRKGDTMYNRRHNDTQTSVTTNHDKGPKPPELDINSNECTIESGPSASGDNNNTNSTGLNSRLTKLMKQQQEDSDRLFAIQLMEEEELEYRNFLKCGRSKYNLRKRYHPYTTGKS